MPAHRIVSTAVIAGILPGLGGMVQAEEAGVPQPPFDAPAVIVTFDWPDEDELLLLYSATLSPDPLGNPAGPQGVSWAAGCNPDAIIANEIQPLVLGESIGFDGGNRSPWPGNYTIVAEFGGYCAYYSDGTDRVDQARYDRALAKHPPGTEITVAATVQYFDPGAIAPSRTETLSAQVPLLLPVTDMRPHRRILGQQGGVVVPAGPGTVGDGNTEDGPVTGDEGGSGEGVPPDDAASPTGGSAEGSAASADSAAEDQGDAGSGTAAASDLFEGFGRSGWKTVGVAAFIILLFAFLVGITSLSLSTPGAVASAFVEVAEKARFRKRPPPPPPPPPPD